MKLGENQIIKPVIVGVQNTSLRITVPHLLAELLNIKEKDEIYWKITISDSNIKVELITDKNKVLNEEIEHKIN